MKLLGWINTSPEEVPNSNMENRIGRKDDEGLYQPKIHSKRIRTLYQLKQAMGKPMTVLVDQAIRDFEASYGVICQPGFEEEPIMEKVDKETWEEICEYRQLLDHLDYQRCLAELQKLRGNRMPEAPMNPVENDERLRS